MVVDDSTRHRFLSFPAQLKQLKVSKFGSGVFSGSSYGQTASLLPGEDASSTRTLLTLDKWRDLNLSEGFQRVYRTCAPLCGSLGQLLYHRERLAKLLEEEGEAELERDSPLGLEPLLDLWASLAADVRDLFEPHLKTFVRLCARSLLVEDTKVLRQCHGRLNDGLRAGRGSLNDNQLLNLLEEALKEAEESKGKKYPEAVQQVRFWHRFFYFTSSFVNYFRSCHNAWRASSAEPGTARPWRSTSSPPPTPPRTRPSPPCT